jgi:hypothetical protein
MVAQRSMSDAVVAVIGLVGSATAATIAAYAGTRHRIRAELESKYDAALRDLRLAVYPDLWGALEPLAKYAREPLGYPTRDDIVDLTATLRRWYFETGGLYLSAETREAYFDLQDGLTIVVSSPRWAETDSYEELDDETFETLRVLGSRLRTRLTYDVGTRRPFSLAPEDEDLDSSADKRRLSERWETSDEPLRVAPD